jgi:uncharacterized protein
MSVGKIPGFVLEPEIARLPTQEVSFTAVPVFIGYVQQSGDGVIGEPVYIARYAEYERRFCQRSGSEDSNPWVDADAPEGLAKWGPYLRRSVYLYFLNGGGPCYVLPVGLLDPDHAPAAAHFAGVVRALDRVSAITLVVPTDAILLPPADYFQLCSDLLRHCASDHQRFCIMDAGSAAPIVGNGNAAAKQFSRSLGETHLAWGAAYYPYLRLRSTSEAQTGQVAMAAPKIGLSSAVVAAAIVVTDQSRGIWKAPANVEVQGIVGLSAAMTLHEMGDLATPADGKSVNLIRSIHGRGFFIWGVRTLASDDAQWCYLNVRRLVSFVESALRERTLFAVFEPNNMRTWIIVKGICESFLRDLWEAGGLAGTTRAEAFKVAIGLGESMTQADIDEGRMVAMVQVAAKHPAEFITIKLFHQVQALGN